MKLYQKEKKRLQLTYTNSAFGAWKCYSSISNLLSCPEPKQPAGNTVNLMQGRDQSQTVLSLRRRLDLHAPYRTTVQLLTPVTKVKSSPRPGKQYIPAADIGEGFQRSTGGLIIHLPIKSTANEIIKIVKS